MTKLVSYCIKYREWMNETSHKLLLEKNIPEDLCNEIMDVLDHDEIELDADMPPMYILLSLIINKKSDTFLKLVHYFDDSEIDNIHLIIVAQRKCCYDIIKYFMYRCNNIDKISDCIMANIDGSEPMELYQLLIDSNTDLTYDNCK